MNLVLTIAIGKDYDTLAELTHPSIKRYADRIGADFIAITQQAISKTTPHWEKFQIFYFLEKYDRVLYIDTDIIIRDDCPNLFDVVPDTHLGMFEEGRFTDRSKELMIDICKAYDVVLSTWDGRYYNSGVMVISKVHKSMFKKPEKEVYNFYEQSYLNMIIAKREIDMFPLEHKFNRMTCMDRFLGEERFDSFIIHYAGYPNMEYLLNLIPQDIARWERDRGNYIYKKHIYISVTGGLGDQMDAEPAVRFMREKLYPEDEFIIATHFPRLFSHINATVVEHGKAELRSDTPYYIGESFPGPDRIQWSIVSNLLCHTVDYCSIALMHRTLPVLDRQMKFELLQKDFEKLYAKMGRSDIDDFVVVHPGKHWNSKTFPVGWWQQVIDGIKGDVCIIGKDSKGDPPFYTEGARGTVPVVARDGVTDLRNKLSLGELAALLSRAKVLVSNDSFPVHLAGAFDNRIVLIPSCKHPDHILPYRNGSILYKTKALYKRLVIDDVEGRPTQVYPTTVEMDDIDWDKYLPEPYDLVSIIKNT